MNLWGLGPLLGGIFIIYASAALFPNGNIILASLLSIIPCGLLSMVYAYFAVAMPRSGGDYIFTSRSLNPALGFFMNFNFIFWVLVAWYPYNVWLESTFSIALLKSIGFVGAYNFLMEPTAFFIFGIAYTALMALLVIAGLRTYVKVQWIATILSALGIIVALAVLGMHYDGLAPLFNRFAQPYTGAGDSISFVIDQAKENGHQFTGWTTSDLWGSMCVMWFVFCFPIMSNWLVGETKRADAVKTHLISMTGTAIVSGILITIAAVFVTGLAGWNFYTSFSFLTLNGLTNIPTTAEYYNLFFIVEPNATIQFLFNLGYTAAAFLLVPLDLMLFARCTFAWSFDRLTPSFLSDINPRFHTPAKTIIIYTLIGFASYWFFMYSGMYGVLAAATLGVTVAFLLTSIAGIIFPYKMKELYQASPAKKEIAGVPVITLAGIGSTVFQLAAMATWIINPSLRGFAVTETVGELIVVMFILCVVWFYAAKAYRMRKEGIDMSWAFRELPPG
jgi:amino acid transporter